MVKLWVTRGPKSTFVAIWTKGEKPVIVETDYGPSWEREGGDCVLVCYKTFRDMLGINVRLGEAKEVTFHATEVASDQGVG